MIKNSKKKQLRPSSGLLVLLLSVGVTLIAACGSNRSQPELDSGAPNSPKSSAGQSSNSATHSADNQHGLPGFYVSGDTLYDFTGRPFTMRGVNYPYAWYRDSHQAINSTEQQFADIASTGANTVRVVLSNGEQWNRVNGDEVANIIEWAKVHQMVVVLEVHDATGWPQNDKAAHPDTAVDYWLSEDIRPVIEGEEQYILINIANEPLGNFENGEEDYQHWVDFHVSAIETLREAGLTHTLIVDAPNWGQDWRNIMRDSDGAQTIFEADPVGSVVFSVHMYDVYDTANKVEAYYSRFADKALPSIVGEFAADHGEDGNVAQEAIMAGAEAYGFGYLGWSWSGNSSHLSSLDIVENFDVNQLSAWGQSLIEGENGIRATSEVCYCFLVAD